jgi:hypothetical protein
MKIDKNSKEMADALNEFIHDMAPKIIKLAIHLTKNKTKEEVSVHEFDENLLRILGALTSCVLFKSVKLSIKKDENFNKDSLNYIEFFTTNLSASIVEFYEFILSKKELEVENN